MGTETDMTITTFSANKFEEMSWHDNKIHGFSFIQDKFTSDILFDIDYIVEWGCKEDCKFLIAPASLIFHNVTDLELSIDWGESNFQKSVTGLHIVEIKRYLVKTPMKFPEYYKWCIDLSDKRSNINFGASGFTQNLRAKAIWVNQQSLTIARDSLLPDRKEKE